ncbi:MAG: D-alanyl-D-alanine carboxypeptidase [Ruminococcaceae bacterium]|nr:D-alanyl-D-alanine carboxypeptidase [Oscillospiraceae bacterium]
MSSEKIKKTASVDDGALNLIVILLIACILIVVITGVYFIVSHANQPVNDDDKNDVAAGANGDLPFRVQIDTPSFVDNNCPIIESINSEYAIIVDATDSEILATRRGTQMIYPASMTKVMTLIVVVENLKSEAALNDVITISIPRGEHSGYGFEMDEKLTVEDLLYASILQSDGVACIELAKYIAGSEAQFVKLMNEKAAELGLGKSTLFQNCSGLHHNYHYSTPYDMAVIMAYAMENPLCAKVLTAIKYNPSDNFRPGQGSTFWHKFIHNHLDDGDIQPQNATIIAGKTGLTEKETSGHCIVSYAKGADGHYYVSVTAKAKSWSANVDDILYLFNAYVK